jgi:hypothetical protein
MRRPGIVLGAVLAALAAPALAHAAGPPIARPNPVTYPVHLDYVDALGGAGGETADMAPLEQDVISAAVTDTQHLHYLRVDDLGGFIPATVGALALHGGRNLGAPGVRPSQIPLFSSAADGEILSFTFAAAKTAGTTGPPDNGNNPGTTPPPPPTPDNVPPPANQGFGGRPSGGHGGGGSQTTTTTRGRGHGGGSGSVTVPTPPTTTTLTTTVTTTTAATAGSGGGGGSGVGCSGGSCSAGACGMAGLSVDSSIPGCTITIATAAPGDSATETFTIQNTSGSPYTLSFMANGPNDNHLWQDLEMDVYDPSGGAPSPPLPPLTSWLGSFHALTTLNPGQTVQYVVELYLPTTAGNEDQGKSAVIDFSWNAG